MNADPTPTADFPLTVPQAVAGAQPLAESLPGFDLHDELGRGGNGVVYRSTQRGTGREVALKLMATDCGVGWAGQSFRIRSSPHIRTICHCSVPVIKFAKSQNQLL